MTVKSRMNSGNGWVSYSGIDMLGKRCGASDGFHFSKICFQILSCTLAPLP